MGKVDPSGEFALAATAGIGLVAGAVIGALVYWFRNRSTPGIFRKMWGRGTFWRYVAVGAAIGGLVGAGVYAFGPGVASGTVGRATVYTSRQAVVGLAYKAKDVLWNIALHGHKGHAAYYHWQVKIGAAIQRYSLLFKKIK